MVVGDFRIETDTIVIGAGPGGYVAAIRAAQLGQKVTIVEKVILVVFCLNVGCIPSKALLHASHRFVEAQHSENLGVIAESVSLNFQKVQEFKSSVVNKLTGGVEGLLKGNKVNIVKGEAYSVDNNSLRVMDERAHKHTTLKMQSLQQVQRPIEIPNFKFGKRVIDSNRCLNLQEVPGKLVVVGGGYIGSELGTAFANFGSEVTILEGAKDLLGGFEKQMTQPVKKGMKEKGVEIVTEAMAKSAEETDNGVKVTYEAKGEEENNRS
ncbi:FAD-dependent oxidoreductase [Staphylococcus aureus]|nr:FAD-dependent oxidoreductase [Staphylococcus aureus]